MSPVIHVSHPAPVRLRRRGPRPGALEFLAVMTPVTLREADAMRMVRRGTGAPREARAVYEAEGRAWARLDRERLRNDGTWDRAPFTVQSFVDRLASGNRWDMPGAFDFAARSPLLACHAPRLSAVIGWVGGERAGRSLAADTRVATDGRDMARDALVAHLDRNVRVLDDRVYVPYEGTHLAMWQRHPSNKLARHELATVAAPRKFLARTQPEALLVPASLADRALLLARDVLANGPYVPDVRLPDSLPEGNDLPGEETAAVLAHANEMPSRVLRWLASAHPEALSSDAGRALAGWEMRGTIGAVGEADAAEVLALCAGTVRTHWNDGSMSPRTRMGAVVAYVERIALPWLADRRAPLRPEDESAMTGLGM